MKRFAGVIILLFTACGRGSLDTSSSSADVDGDSLSTPIRWKSPRTSLTTNGSVVLTVTVSGGAPDSVTFYADQQVVATLTAAPYTYALDTRNLAEGSYTLTAHASRAGQELVSARRILVVQRTGPSLVSSSVPTDAVPLSPGDCVELQFSAPVAPDSLASVTVTDSAGAPLAHSFLDSGAWQQLCLDATIPLPATVHLQIGPGVTDFLGNSFVGGYDVTYRVTEWVPATTAVGLTATDAQPLSIASSSEGRVFSVWPVLASGYGLPATPVLAELLGGTWSPVAGGSLPFQLLASAQLKLVTDSEGLPVAAFTDGKAIAVFRYQSGAWKQLGTAFNDVPPGGPPVNPLTLQLASAADGALVVAWTEGLSWHLRRWTAHGQTWAELGTTPVSAYPVRDLRLTLDAEGNPVVGWRTGFAAIEAGVSHWSGTGWEAWESVPEAFPDVDVAEYTMATNDTGQICAVYGGEHGAFSAAGMSCFDGLHWQSKFQLMQLTGTVHAALAPLSDGRWVVAYTSDLGDLSGNSYWTVNVDVWSPQWTATAFTGAANVSHRVGQAGAPTLTSSGSGVFLGYPIFNTGPPYDVVGYQSLTRGW